jgi:energy-converting hydrogenase Eha subunit G
MHALRRKAWPLFLLAFVLGVTGILIGGVVGGLIAATCIAFFILGSLRKLGQTAHDLPGTERITGTWVTDLDKHKRKPPG